MPKRSSRPTEPPAPRSAVPVATPAPWTERHTGEGSASALATLQRQEAARQFGTLPQPPAATAAPAQPQDPPESLAPEARR